MGSGCRDLLHRQRGGADGDPCVAKTIGSSRALHRFEIRKAGKAGVRRQRPAASRAKGGKISADGNLSLGACRSWAGRFFFGTLARSVDGPAEVQEASRQPDLGSTANWQM